MLSRNDATMVGIVRVKPNPTFASWLLVRGLTVFMVIALAVGLHVAFERPARALLRRLLDPLGRARRPLPGVNPAAAPAPD